MARAMVRISRLGDGPVETGFLPAPHELFNPCWQTPANCSYASGMSFLWASGIWVKPPWAII